MAPNHLWPILIIASSLVALYLLYLAFAIEPPAMIERPEIRNRFKWWIVAVLVATFALLVIHYVLRIV